MKRGLNFLRCPHELTVKQLCVCGCILGVLLVFASLRRDQKRPHSTTFGRNLPVCLLRPSMDVKREPEEMSKNRRQNFSARKRHLLIRPLANQRDCWAVSVVRVPTTATQTFCWTGPFPYRISKSHKAFRNRAPSMAVKNYFAKRRMSCREVQPQTESVPATIYTNEDELSQASTKFEHLGSFRAAGEARLLAQ